MKRMICAVTMFVAVFAVGGFAQPYPTLTEGAPGVDKGYMTRYWDGCKQSCSWLKKSPNLIGACKNCDENNNELPVVDGTDNNACTKGNNAYPKTYTCWDMIPFVDPVDTTIAYGFVATHGAEGDQCGTCFQLQFMGRRGDGYTTNPAHQALINKTLIVMAANIGPDVKKGNFDLLVPGGGLGIHDAFSEQLGYAQRAPELGNDYGGLVRDCEDSIDRDSVGGIWANANVTMFRTCNDRKCNEAFGKTGHEQLKEGCLTYSSWFMGANNPEVLSKKLDKCPDILIDRYVEGSGGSHPTPGSAGYTPPPPRRTIVNINADRSTGASDENGRFISIVQGTSETYDIKDIPEDGEYTVTFGLATGQNTQFSVSINGQNAGSVSLPNGTGNYSVVSAVEFDNNVTLKKGDNTITMNYQTSDGNIIYIRLISVPAPSSIQHGIARPSTSAKPNITLKTTQKGFTATLPANHGYTSYKLIDLRGREIRRGMIGAGVTDLRITGINRGMVFLRLEGAGKTPAVVRAMSVR